MSAPTLEGKSKVTLTIAGCIAALVAAFTIGRMAQDRDARLEHVERVYVESQVTTTAIDRRLTALEGEVVYIRRMLEQAKEQRLRRQE